MAITSTDIINLMKEAGIATEIVDNLKNDVPLLKQGMDSIDFPLVAVATEKKYGVNLSDADASKLKTVDDFVSFVNSKVK